jgi:hypothetical protein
MATNIGTGPQDIPLNQFLGEMAFMDRPPQRVAFDAWSTTAFNYGSNPQILPCNNSPININGCYDTTTYQFTAPSDGVYMFFCLVSVDNNGASQVDDTGGLTFLVNGSSYGYPSNNGGAGTLTDQACLFNPRYMQGGDVAGTEMTYNHFQMISLTAGQTVEAAAADFTNTSGGTPVYIRAKFCGFQIT